MIAAANQPSFELVGWSCGCIHGEENLPELFHVLLCLLPQSESQLDPQAKVRAAVRESYKGIGTDRRVTQAVAQDPDEICRIRVAVDDRPAPVQHAADAEIVRQLLANTDAAEGSVAQGHAPNLPNNRVPQVPKHEDGIERLVYLNSEAVIGFAGAHAAFDRRGRDFQPEVGCDRWCGSPGASILDQEEAGSKDYVAHPSIPDGDTIRPDPRRHTVDKADAVGSIQPGDRRTDT